MANHQGARARSEQTIAAFAAIVASLLGTTAAIAQEPGELTVDVGKCAVLESPEARFACYEAAVDAAKENPRAATTPRNPNADVAPPPAEPTDRRVEEAAVAPAAQNGTAAQSPRPAPKIVPLEGRDTEPQPRTERNARTHRAERNPGVELSGTVAGLRETVPNAVLITLDNGQVWRQNQPKAYPLRTGHKVRLYSTAWGASYRLESDSVPGFIQVERVK
jgi:hypothetical protein